MPTSHWVFSSVDSSSVGPFYVRNLDVAVPAGATMKRFLLNNCSVTSRHSEEGFQQINMLYQQTTVEVISGQYNGRELYRQTVRVPMEIAAFFDSSNFQRIYSAYYYAGDRELGINEKCSYGTRDGPGFTVRCQVSGDKQAGGFNVPNVAYRFVFRVLYLTP